MIFRYVRVSTRFIEYLQALCPFHVLIKFILLMLHIISTILQQTQHIQQIMVSLNVLEVWFQKNISILMQLNDFK